LRKPNLFIVGQEKAGTTALHDFLSQHPDIFMSDPKELGYFAKDYHKESDMFHKRVRMVGIGNRSRFFPYRTLKEYMGVFRDVKAQKVIGESSPGYMYSQVAAKDIHAFNPDAKIIMMIREPTEFLYSLHSQYVFNLDEPVEDFEKALSLEETRKKGKSMPTTVAHPSNLYYHERAKYIPQIERFFKYFDRKNIKIILFNDFKKDNLSVVKSVFRFLDVDSTFEPKMKIRNPNKIVKHKRIKYVLDRFSVALILKGLLPKKAYNVLSRAFQKQAFEVKPREKMDPALRKRLMKKYRGEVERLGRLLKLDLIRLWGYDRIR